MPKLFFALFILENNIKTLLQNKVYMRVFCRICTRMIYGTFDCSFSSKKALKNLDVCFSKH